MLLKDEQYVIKWLSQYGALPKTQIMKLLQKPEQTAEKILRNLKKQMRVADISGATTWDWILCASRTSVSSLRYGCC